MSRTGKHPDLLQYVCIHAKPNPKTTKRDTHLPASSTTVANMNSVDLSFAMTAQLSSAGETPSPSSSSFEPDAVFVGASSAIIREPLLLPLPPLPSSVVSASLRVWTTFSMTLPPMPAAPLPPTPPVISSVRCGCRAARCLAARMRSA